MNAMDTSEPDPGPGQAPAAVLEVEQLRFTYPGNRPAVRGISFAVRRGEIFGLLGPSGAGKSTTQRLLLGLLQGYEGSIRLFGEERSRLGPALFERVGVGFEFPKLYGKLTARENLQLFASLYRGETESPEALLREVGLEDAADQRVAHFSKGMKMRLDLCRALVHRPELVFLDEPTSGQDPANTRRIEQLLLDRKARGRTIFLTTHDMHVARSLCDRVAFVVDGEIRALDTPRALTLAHGERRVRIERRDATGRLLLETFALDGLADEAAFQAALRTGGVETLHTSEAGLDEVFLRVTGRALS